MEVYPNRKQPNFKLFQQLYARLGETGAFKPKRHQGRLCQILPEQEDEILARVVDDPETIIRNLSAATNISKSTIHRILKRKNLYPYHFAHV